MRAFPGFAAAVTAFAVTALGAAAAPTGADDVAAITANLAAAAASINSFVLEMQVTGTTGVGGSMTFVRPMRMKSEFVIGAMAVQTYFVDDVFYMHLPSNGWQKTTLEASHLPPVSMNLADSLSRAKVTVLSDRQENGATVGVIRVDTQIPNSVGTPMMPSGPQHIVCSYDKQSFRLRICTNDIMTMTYTRYNDPRNSVVLPPDAKNAKLVVLPSPPAAGGPATAPLPAASEPSESSASPLPPAAAPSAAPFPPASGPSAAPLPPTSSAEPEPGPS
jgi:hypothetical protein